MSNAFSILISVFLVELFAHAYYQKRYVPYNWVYLGTGEWNVDKDFIFITQKVQNRINQIESKPVDPLILTIGDSFTQGDPVDEKDSFPSQLQQSFSSNENDVVVVNLGVGGYGPDQQLKLLESVLERGARPKTVIWQFFPNDIYENLAQATYTINERGQLEQLDTTKNWIYRSQYIYHNLPLPNAIKENSAVINYLLSYSQSYEFSSVPESKRANYETMDKWALDKFELELNRAEELAKQYNFSLHYVLISPQYTYLDHNEKDEELSWISDYEAYMLEKLKYRKNFLYINFNKLKEVPEYSTYIDSYKEYKHHYFDDGSRDPMKFGNRHFNELGYKALTNVVYHALHKVSQ